MCEISIRAEILSDYDAIHNLIVEVFHETFGSGEEEATLVEQLREEPGHRPTISLVAELNGTVVGHIFFSTIQLEDHPDISVCALGPLCVYRKYQKQGIGSKMVQRGIKKCVDQGYKIVVVQGSLQYYPRFGFIPIDRTHLHTIFRSSHDMVLQLENDILGNVKGLIDYPRPWQVFKED
ncbi:MAG: N-acetyltransferase [Candidatus Latescibacterota bacterium]|nr:N-acetyltransferase [Candidatus Latescibacterota bacterium]